MQQLNFQNMQSVNFYNKSCSHWLHEILKPNFSFKNIRNKVYGRVYGREREKNVL